MAKFASRNFMQAVRTHTEANDEQYIDNTNSDYNFKLFFANTSGYE